MPRSLHSVRRHHHDLQWEDLLRFGPVGPDAPQGPRRHLRADQLLGQERDGRGLLHALAGCWLRWLGMGRRLAGLGVVLEHARCPVGDLAGHRFRPHHLLPLPHAPPGSPVGEPPRGAGHQHAASRSHELPPVRAVPLQPHDVHIERGIAHRDQRDERDLLLLRGGGPERREAGALCRCLRQHQGLHHPRRRAGHQHRGRRQCRGRVAARRRCAQARAAADGRGQRRAGQQR
mmetsp:Transcript_166219/g.403841  ORF Transcript_166219/g.403841 Transcript_166219/m.403841 type:complete len:232 (+) Transcript_166219:1384-2079(+)